MVDNLARVSVKGKGLAMELDSSMASPRALLLRNNIPKMANKLNRVGSKKDCLSGELDGIHGRQQPGQR
jgi:hypothetical protein